MANRYSLVFSSLGPVLRLIGHCVIGVPQKRKDDVWWRGDLYPPVNIQLKEAKNDGKTALHLFHSSYYFDDDDSSSSKF